MSTDKILNIIIEDGILCLHYGYSQEIYDNLIKLMQLDLIEQLSATRGIENNNCYKYVAKGNPLNVR